MLLMIIGEILKTTILIGEDHDKKKKSLSLGRMTESN